jgi:general secretion pathway protein A
VSLKCRIQDLALHPLCTPTRQFVCRPVLCVGTTSPPRVRLALDYASREELSACLNHLLDSAGAATLMSATLKHTLCERAGGNYRVMTNMAAQLLAVAAQRQLPSLDDKLYLDVFAAPSSATNSTRRNSRGHA